MSAQIRPAVTRDIDSICTLLHEKMNSRIPVDRWRNLMTYRWLDNKPDYGRVVESNGKVLGFCGMVYADRQIGNARTGTRTERIVSMSSWYLDKSLRGQGFGRDMLLSAIEDPALSYATLTNSRKPLGIVEALGFRVLENQRLLWRKESVIHNRQSVLITEDPTDIRARVEPAQQQLLDDMRELPLKPMVVQCEGKQALLFFSIKPKGADVIWFDLMYTSDPELFADCAQSLADILLPETPAVLASDSRFFSQVPDGCVIEPLPVARYFVSERVEPHEIDNLYSELQLLNLKLD